MTREQEWEAALQQRADKIAAAANVGSFDQRAREVVAGGKAALRQLVRETYPHFNKSARHAIIRRTLESLRAAA